MMFSNTSDFCPLEAYNTLSLVTAQNVSKHGQMSIEGGGLNGP